MDSTQFTTTIATEQQLNEPQVAAVAGLLAEGASIPFIARYRKEATGGLDEVAVCAIRDRFHQLQELADRRAAILSSLEKNGHLTDELKKKVLAAGTLAVLEDIYLPYRPKRRTRAVVAREKGLEPLALELTAQEGGDPLAAAAAFVDAEKEVETPEDALAGARDIIAEMVNESDAARARMRHLFETASTVKSRVAPGMEAEGAKYEHYFEWEEPLSRVPSHRMLAMRRGEKEKALMLHILPPEESALADLNTFFVKGDGPDAAQVAMAVQDSYKRLLSVSMELETRLTAKKRADAEAITVFAQNLRQLLLAPPLGARRVMGIDPGFRTGCKIACLDRQGKLIHYDTIMPHTSEKMALQAAEIVTSLVREHRIEAIAVGNGTAGRETEAFLKRLELDRQVTVVMVNESGASVYSASEAAREEFPDLDLTIRGAVSIGRRLMDPLAELVKIDPKAIGVGQYQHDVDPKALKQALDDVVISCVNAVGVDLNRASAQLLAYVSGLNAGIARNIVAYREANGAFTDRGALLKVPRLGPKAFEQCAGFLRIPNGANPLDASAVHPERYPIVNAMAADLGATVADLMQRSDLRRRIDISRYVSPTLGIPTLEDILEELAKPGRDPRARFEAFSFAEGVEKIEDLQPGMRLPGIVTNITDFGAFVDIGVHQDGLVHISQLSDRFVKHPSDVLKVQQTVQVTVLDVDLARKRIALSRKGAASREGSPHTARKSTPQKQRRRAPQPAKQRRSPKPAVSDSPLAAALKKSGL